MNDLRKIVSKPFLSVKISLWYLLDILTGKVVELGDYTNKKRIGWGFTSVNPPDKSFAFEDRYERPIIER